LARLSPVTWRELTERLRQLGFEGPYEGGKHPYMVRRDVVVTVPNPHRSAVSGDLLQRILRRAGITRDEWLARES